MSFRRLSQDPLHLVLFLALIFSWYIVFAVGYSGIAYERFVGSPTETFLALTNALLAFRHFFLIPAIVLFHHYNGLLCPRRWRVEGAAA